MNTVLKYGNPPHRIGLVHGGPGAAGEMRPVALELSQEFGVLELLQSAPSVKGQIRELHDQLTTAADNPVILVGYSWGAWLALLYAGEHSDTAHKLVLVGTSPFTPGTSADIMQTRLSRLNRAGRREVRQLSREIKSGNSENESFRRFGELMTIADSYSYQPPDDFEITVDLKIYQSVWREAAALRDSGELLESVMNIKCPVVAIHGEKDPHPIEGVEQPLSDRLPEFRMIRLERCGHTPWNEKYARTTFFEVLKNELRGEKR